MSIVPFACWPLVGSYCMYELLQLAHACSSLQITPSDSDSDKYPTPSCVCNTGIGDTEHFIQRCPIFAKEREAMHDAIYSAYHANNIDPTLRVTDTHTILGLNKSTPATIIPVIANALGSFIRSSNKSI